RSGWVVDQSVSKVIDAGVDYAFGVTLRGTSVSVTLNSQVVVSNAFNAVVVDGHFGLLTRGGATNFDNVSIKTDDPAFTPQANAAPIARDDSAATNRGVAVTISVLANDTDANNDLLTVTSITQPSSGSAVLNPNGTITYTPASGFTGTITFTYAASDGRAQSNVATVTVQVLLPPNSPPVAAYDGAITIRDTAVAIPVLANDTDADGQSLTVANLTQPATGTGSVVLNGDGTVTYTPASGFVGTATFTYQASDGVSLSA